MDWRVKKASNVCTDIMIPYSGGDWEQWGLITADEHVDNPHSRNDLHKYHLSQAVERGAFVLSFGDFFDAMQGKNDRRSSKGDLKGEVKSAAYLNALTDFGREYLLPYKDNLAMFSEGNHETGVLKNAEYNLTDALVRDLSREGSQIVKGTYRGWIRFMFEHKAGGHKQSYTSYYTHGYGGGGPVTKGVIQASRKAVYLRGADIVFQGHIHEQWKFPIAQVGIDQTGKEVKYTQMHCQIPTYKEEFVDVGGGWHHERGGPPKPVGAWWLRFYWSARDQKVRYQLIEADV